VPESPEFRSEPLKAPNEHDLCDRAEERLRVEGTALQLGHLAAHPPISEDELLDLPGAGEGELLDLETLLRRLVRREMFAEVGEQLLLVHGLTGRGPDERTDSLAPLVVG
jgi:hypothetical protein